MFEDYTSDVLINVKSGTGQVLDYKLDRHADYDVDGNGSMSMQRMVLLFSLA